MHSVGFDIAPFDPMPDFEVHSNSGRFATTTARTGGWRVSYGVPISRTILCSMFGLCRVHVRGMLGPCWLYVGQCWAH